MKQKILTGLLFLFLIVVMFYPVFLKGFIPFPGDLLVSEYQPWKSYSHNGIAPGGVPNKAQYFDAIRQMYPWQTLTTASVKNKQFPLWNPNNFSGTPFFANIQSSVLYPLKFFYLLLPQHIAWTILIILQPLLSLIFMFWYMKTLRCSFEASLLSSISYAWCLFASTFLEYNTINHILYLLPLSLVCIEQIKIRLKASYVLILILSISIALFAGHIQVWSGYVAFLLLYSGIRCLLDSTVTKPKSFFFSILLLILLGIGISAIQLIPTIELILQSARTSQPYSFLLEHLLIQPYQLILYIIPDLFGNPVNRNYLLADSYATKALYIGVVPILFAVCTLWLHIKDSIVKTYWILYCIIIIFIIRSPLSNAIYGFPIPFFSSSSPSNFIFLLSVCLSVLAGFGFDAMNQKNRMTIIRTLFFLFFVFILIFIYSRFFHSHISLKNYIYSFGIFLSISAILFILLNVPKMRTLCITLLLLVTFADLFYFFHKFNPFVPTSYLYPNNSLTSWLKEKPGENRIWGYGSAGLQENIASYVHYYSPEGYDPLYSKQYGKLIQSSKDGILPTVFTNQTRSDAVIYPGWGETDMSTNTYRQKILSLTGTKYILTRIEDPISEKTFPLSHFTLTDQFDGWKIFQSTRALPRIFITNKYELFENDAQFQQKFFEPAFDPKTTILLEKNPEIASSNIPIIASASITSLQANTVTITTNSNQPALLFLSDTYYPGWHAYVDTVQTPIYRAHYAFRAITIPMGTHTIEFHYEPFSFSLGLKITLACIMLTGGYLLYIKFHAE